ncbi:hypothetical protein [Mucilaginibacter sp.]
MNEQGRIRLIFRGLKSQPNTIGYSHVKASVQGKINGIQKPVAARTQSGHGGPGIVIKESIDDLSMAIRTEKDEDMFSTGFKAIKN